MVYNHKSINRKKQNGTTYVLIDNPEIYESKY